MYEKMKHEEVIALLEFVKERVREIYPKSIFFGKKKMESRLRRMEDYFIDVLESGENNFYGAVWHYFESSDRMFLGKNGLRELAENTCKEGDTWIYRGVGKDGRVIYDGQ